MTGQQQQKNFLRRFIEWVIPPPVWRIPVIVLLGILTGGGMLIFHVSNASSYLSNDPETCINCHVMFPEYATWQRSAHGKNVTCNDCHVPQDHIVRSYYFKAQDGMRHAYMFTFRLEPQVIRMHAGGQQVVQENCIRCHDHLLHRVSSGTVTLSSARHGEGKLCWDCHRETPHGRVHSLSSAPYARLPLLSSVVPEWIQKTVQTTNTENPQAKEEK